MANETASHAGRLLSRKEAAEFLNLQPQTLACWGMDGRHLPVVKLGRTVRYKQSDLEAFVARQTVGTSD